MIRTVFVSAGVVGAMTLSLVAAPAQQPKDLGKKASIEFTEATRVGNTTLEPGHYAISHQMADGQHYLVFRKQTTEYSRTPGLHWAGATKEEVARVPCQILPATRRPYDAVQTRADGGIHRFNQIVFRGSSWGHATGDVDAAGGID